MILALFLFLGALSAQQAMGRTYVDNQRAFSLQVPSHWHAEAADYSVVHYRDVFLCVNSRDSGLRVQNKSLPHGSTYGAETVAEQLSPGTIYVDFAYFEGPGGLPRYGPGREDSFDTALAEFLKRRLPSEETEELESYRFSFVKWGNAWSIWMYLRKPYSEDEKKQAFAMLKSLQFQERPIVNEAQAVRVALGQLPREAQPNGEWLARSGRCGSYSTAIKQRQTDFMVVFTLYATGAGDNIVGCWGYLVRANGSVQRAYASQ